MPRIKSSDPEQSSTSKSEGYPEPVGSAEPFIDPGPPDSQEPPIPEQVWTFRGYKLHGSEFTTAMVHFFRAEVQRANVWRQRLDTTTNWAVLTTGAAISYAFGNPDSLHAVILLNLLFVTMFLYIEARRYRYYEVWSYRVRLMETDFFAAMLVPPFQPSPDWAEALADNLLHPHFPISMWEAFGRRLRRNYLWIYALIGLAWAGKIVLYPTVILTWSDIVDRTAIGSVHGGVVITIIAIIYLTLLAVSIFTIGLQDASGEVLPRFGGATTAAGRSAASTQGESNVRPWYRPSHRRQQLLTLIITGHAQPIANRIMQEMGRGVTGLNATGMFTGQGRSVLLCAVTVTEVARLRSLVAGEDPQAFVIVSPAQEVFGKGFMPLTEEKHS